MIIYLKVGYLDFSKLGNIKNWREGVRRSVFSVIEDAYYVIFTLIFKLS